MKKEYALNADGHMHIVGIHAHVASHSHSHPHGHHSCAEEIHSQEHISPSVSNSSSRHTVVSQVIVTSSYSLLY